MIRRFHRDERGGTALEYALIASLVSVAIVGGIMQWSDQVVALFAHIKDSFAP